MWIKKFESQFLLNKPLIKYPIPANLQSKPNSNKSVVPLDLDKDIRDVYRPSVPWGVQQQKPRERHTRLGRGRH